MSSSTATTAKYDDDDTNMEDIRKQKQELRKQLRSAMKNLTVKDIEIQSKSVWEKVFKLPIYQNAKSVGLFLSMPMGEINTDLILQHCVQNGKVCTIVVRYVV
jgi:5-formyltetrahydrofolate cyclo-ligase